MQRDYVAIKTQDCEVKNAIVQGTNTCADIKWLTEKTYMAAPADEAEQYT